VSPLRRWARLNRGAVGYGLFATLCVLLILTVALG
jgi:hypothetical protein